MDTVTMSRALMGSSLGFHIIFATLGVGIPFMILLAELIHYVKKDADFGLMAKRWTRAQAILLGVAIPSGTIVGVMLALLWPGFMEIVGEVIALPFQIEIWAFFLEALFMAIYVYAADRLTPVMRIISVGFVALGASASAVLITDAHAWMNTPRGFRIENGQILDVNPWAAVFNPSVWTTASHVLLSAYMTGAFAVVSIAAYKLLRGQREERERKFHQKALFLALFVGLAMSLGTAFNGHATAQMLHEYQPEKLAAAEGLFETQAYAPLAIGGWVDGESQRIIGAIHLPGMLSFLAGNRLDTVVKGLNEFPREHWPPLHVHVLFNLMVGIGSLLIFIAVFALFVQWLRKRLNPWMLRMLVPTGGLAILGIETGWIFSCTGRQPWTIYHVQYTHEAATTADNVGTLFFLFLSLYLFLLVVTGFFMRLYFRKFPVSVDLQKGEIL
ncbi:cytochrome ubiquinol oxidase subunit I [Paenibacillus tarimensis]|uniref:cytochrome ubiquinol oxidase subunit I n=1 Tax=Paenibacillus tarimensis TaxID=416012 RepID=UPI001F38C3CC|nr:cytochrome ubiquinol oxidase subunit I [Paenibacillus tarimensis]MCF2944558.1 cytochrome ubiquinol oxidase subunit I [Paenibacillus tarimensis]